MKIGIGLPNPVPATPGRLLVDWARRAEELGFSGLATIDRIVYPSIDSLAALAAAAGATTRIELLSNILLGPCYPTVLLAKAAASLDQLSGGRFTLGVAPGGRQDDYTAVGADFRTRGRDMEAQLERLHALWSGEPPVEGGKPATPAPVNDGRVPVLVGGWGEAAVRRAVRWGAGLTIGGAGPDAARGFTEQVRSAWRDAGRDGEPRIAALTYYSLGDEVEADSRGYLLDYYAILGSVAQQIADGALRSEAAVRDAVRAFEDAGVTELYLDPTVARLDQVDRLADCLPG